MRALHTLLSALGIVGVVAATTKAELPALSGWEPTPMTAAADTATTASPAADGDNEKPFAKGDWSLQVTGSYYQTHVGSDVDLMYGTIGLGYYVAKNLAFEAAISGFHLEEEGQFEGVAASFGLNVRYHFLVYDPFSVYFDAGAGLIRADGEFPEGGTNTNFTLQIGFGATLRLTDSLHLVGGARWFHISNARRHGEDENASTDGVAVYGGLMWTW